MLRPLSALLCCLPALALAQSVELSFVDAKGNAGPAGSVQIEDTPYGALLTPNLEKLSPGLHGFHVHEKASCAPSVGANGAVTPAGAAGGHWDPDKTGAHAGPYGQGHKGDLPALYVGADGKASYPVLAPRLKAADFAGHALMVHAGGDNHSDHPQPLGGGGARVACGVVK
ncbi:Cu-Zn family superoxide dismutase [Chromobacterium alkanivorans]|uniref:superoxide dismutase [Cu-Zn] SodC n=1 Tax=Chromobacterium alkanivorans TaxID=1071719 RepID=UPI002168CEED|nr:superoxide dismutase [Cu-Zn] SodC [Chromobacterium alkanivorans]MCS3804889.1 Cu-Zn family superoxide dismutase [Chromobacterium alkanivorans]MCS3819548.1 Cu-Zn family superoxide dismutase [Chromobacterium alkanivorans]MCS3874060.1 Cu-Zn family superoxide dismutase [Chromobacterium alkanivorans]